MVGGHGGREEGGEDVEGEVKVDWGGRRGEEKENESQRET